MVNEPTIEDVLRNVVVDAGVIQNDQRRSVVALADDAVEKVDHAFAIDRAGMDLRVQLLRPEIQCSEHGACAVLRRFGGMGLAARGPRPLYRRRGTEAGLIEVDQPDDAFVGRSTATRQSVLSCDELVFGALFLSEKRVRLNDRPRAISPLRSVPSEHGRGA